MDDYRVGAALRALRLDRRWTQEKLSKISGVSRAVISRVEHGRIERVPVGTIRRLFDALEARANIFVRWRGGELDRLIDARHAAVQESVARRLALMKDWVVEAEVTFSIYGERGSVDLVAWHRERRSLLVVEVKISVADVGALIRQVDRYRRLAL